MSTTNSEDYARQATDNVATSDYGTLVHMYVEVTAHQYLPMEFSHAESAVFERYPGLVLVETPSWQPTNQYRTAWLGFFHLTDPSHDPSTTVTGAEFVQFHQTLHAMDGLANTPRGSGIR